MKLMMSVSLQIFICTLASTTAAQDRQEVLQTPSSYGASAEARLTSNRTTRGVSDSALRPSVSMTIEAAHESGLAALVEIATVSRTIFIGGSGSTALLGAGYRRGSAESLRYGAGAYYEFFPGASYLAPVNPEQLFTGGVTRKKFDTGYAIVEIGYGIVDFRYEQSLTRSFRGVSSGSVCPFLQTPTDQFECFVRGDVGSRGTGYLSLILKYSINSNFALSGHVGRQTVRNFAVLNLTDARMSLDYTAAAWSLGLDLTSARAKEPSLYRVMRSDGTVYQANRTHLTLRAGYRF